MSPKARASVALLWEMWAPWVAGAVGFFGTFWVSGLWILNATWKNPLLDKVVAACAIFVAYLATAVTVIPAIESKSIVKRLKDWGYLRIIVAYLRDAIASSGLLLILSLIAVPVPQWLASWPYFDRSFSGLWWGVSLFAVASAVRAVRLLIKTLLAY